MANQIPLSVDAGRVIRFGSTDQVLADGVVPRSGTTLSLGDADTTLVTVAGAAATGITLGGAGTLVAIPGDLEVTGSLTVNSDSMFDGDTIIGDATSDTLTLTARMITSILTTGTSTATTNGWNLGSGANGWNNVYLARDGAGNALATARALSSTSVGAAGATLVGVDITALAVSPANSTLQAVLETLSTTATGGSFQTTYDNGPDITQDATGGIAITRGATSADSHVLRLVHGQTGSDDVLEIDRSPAGAAAGRGVHVAMGANASDAGLEVSHSGTAAGSRAALFSGVSLTSNRGVVEVTHQGSGAGHGVVVNLGAASTQKHLRLARDAGATVTTLDESGITINGDSASGTITTFNISAEIPSADGVAGTNIEISAAPGSASAAIPGGDGGNLLFAAGDGALSTEAASSGGLGGSLSFVAGAGGDSGVSVGPGSGGSISFVAGSASSVGAFGSAAGGNVTFLGGDSSGGNGIGGVISLDPGLGAGSNGSVLIGVTNTPYEIQSGSNGGRTEWTHFGRMVVDGSADDSLLTVREEFANRFIVSTSGGPGAPLVTVYGETAASSNYATEFELADSEFLLQPVTVHLAEVSPEGVISALPGSTCHVRFPSANASDGLWVKLTGSGNTGWSKVQAGSGTVDSLQSAYEAGNTVSVTTAEGSLTFSNSSDATDVLTLTRTFAGAGEGLSIGMGPSNQAVTGRGVEIVSGSGATGSMLFVNNLGTGSAIQIQDGGTDVFSISGSGTVVFAPTSGANFSATTAGAGTVTVQSAAGALNIVNDVSTGTGGGISIRSTSSGSGTSGDVLVYSATSGSGSGGVLLSAGVAVANPLSGQVIIRGSADLDLDGASATLDTTGAISLDAGAASNFTTSSGALTLTSAAAATWGTAAGALTLNGVSGINLQFNGSTKLAVATSTLTVQAGTVLGTTSTGNINLPNNGSARFQVEGAAVGATVTAANLNTLTNGSNADALHVHGASGLSVTAGEALAAGAPAVIANSAGNSRAFNGDADLSTRFDVVGLASAAISSAAIGTLNITGEMTIPDAIFDVPPVAADNGKRVYLSANVGKLTLTAPSAAGTWTQKLGIVTRHSVTGSSLVLIQIGDGYLN